MEHPFGTIKKSSWLARPVVVFLLFLVAVLAVYSVIGMYGKYRRTAAARSVSEAERVALEQKHDALAENTERLGTERGQEEELRSRYRAVRPGEELIVIVDDGAIVEGELTKKSWISKILDSIRGLFLETK